MCLADVTERIDSPTTLILSGWKSFNGSISAPVFSAMVWKGQKAVPLDQWITAEGDKIEMGGWGKGYKAGFHVYADERQLKDIRDSVRRVYYRLLHTYGVQDKHTVIVAKELYVPSDPEGWPPQ
jgi:hypothetical protein